MDREQGSVRLLCQQGTQKNVTVEGCCNNRTKATYPFPGRADHNQEIIWILMLGLDSLHHDGNGK